MPSKLMTADVTSGILKWEGEWRVGGQDADPDVNKYDKGTFRFTEANHSRVSFTFSGSAVEIIGAYRLNDGQYQVYLDNQPQGPFRTNGDGPKDLTLQLYQQPLFSWSGPEGLHNVTLENLPILNQPQPGNPNSKLDHVDIDYVTWTYSSSALEDLTIQDNDLRFQYSGPTWESKISDSMLPQFDQNTGHVTVQNGSYVDISFAGDRISVFGVTGPRCSPYIAQLDNGSISYLNATQNPNNVGQQLLYAASGLATDRNHTVRLTAQPDSSGQVLALDYAVVNEGMNSLNSQTSTSSRPGQPSSSNGRHPIPIGTIAGIVVGSVAALTFLLLAMFFLWRHKRRRTNLDDTSPRDNPPETANLNRFSVSPFLSSLPNTNRTSAPYNTLSSATLLPPSPLITTGPGFPRSHHRQTLSDPPCYCESSPSETETRNSVFKLSA